MEQTQILTEEEISDGLKKLPGWEREGSKIKKEFKFEDFNGVLAFLNELIPFCDEIDHHPDVHIFYNKALFELTRYDVGEKLTNKDFVVAHKIEELYKNIA